ncbi:MAG: ribosome silencing factor [Clostridiales bacterium]|nr:ribosome silencing factor [Clostridia bacterium]MCR5683063.1 ribosome silencing factor [Clostridiales bacterium]
MLRDPETLAKFIVSVLDSKKARDIRLLHVENRTIIADYFVIATGSSRTQIRSFADEVEFKLSGYGVTPHHIEGADTGVWLLEDFGSVVVHIFSGEGRKFYNLDKLYEDTTEHDISALITED